MSKWGDLALAILAGGDPVSASPSAVDRVDSVVSHSSPGLSALKTLTTADGDTCLAERAAIIEEGAKVPRDWADGFARLEAVAPPRGVDRPSWLAVLNAAGRFLDQWGGTAAALGWTAAELFGLDPDAPLNRRDRRGAAFFLANADVVAITAEAITFRIGGSIQCLRRRDGFTVPAWEMTL